MKIFSSIRAWLIDDFAWKIFALILAVAIWLTVHRIVQEAGQPDGAAGGSTLTYGNLPVVIVSGSADVRDYRLLHPTVSVTVSGTAQAIGRLQANQIHATVNLADPGVINSEKHPVEIAVPPGITVVNVKPDATGVIAPPPKE